MPYFKKSSLNVRVCSLCRRQVWD